ncbi:unnamed protein product [Prorocentrum cordatum]|uniref:Secreted protein n=1 Tax=Prorocentrum cordatum TaxID=2364126 RepID=A0ABN9XYS2_9DINO|nr:unnamed protein product [Polarella glacialis]
MLFITLLQVWFFGNWGTIWGMTRPARGGRSRSIFFDDCVEPCGDDDGLAEQEDIIDLVHYEDGDAPIGVTGWGAGGMSRTTSLTRFTTSTALTRTGWRIPPTRATARRIPSAWARCFGLLCRSGF